MPVTVNRAGVPGDLQVRYATYTGPASYATGGEAITPATFGFSSKIEMLQIQAADATAADLRIFVWDDTNSKIMIFTDIDTIAEAANASNQSSVRARMIAWGY
jgi:hypothetical protein